MHIDQQTGEVTWNTFGTGNHSISIVIQNQVGECDTSFVEPASTARL